MVIPLPRWWPNSSLSIRFAGRWPVPPGTPGRRPRSGRGASPSVSGDGVCDAAACALVRIGLPAAPALIEAVSDDDRRLGLRAAAVLTEIVTAPPGSLQSASSPQMIQV